MYELFEHEADMGVKGIGKSLEESLEECAKAMFSIMCNIEKVSAEKEIDVKTTGTDETSLLINWLNELLALKDVEEMMFSKFKVRVEKVDDEFRLDGKAIGEPVNPEKHELKTEVKAATFHQAEVKPQKSSDWINLEEVKTDTFHEAFAKQGSGKWIAQCVVDV